MNTYIIQTQLSHDSFGRAPTCVISPVKLEQHLGEITLGQVSELRLGVQHGAGNSEREVGRESADWVPSREQAAPLPQISSPGQVFQLKEAIAGYPQAGTCVDKDRSDEPNTQP